MVNMIGMEMEMVCHSLPMFYLTLLIFFLDMLFSALYSGSGSTYLSATLWDALLGDINSLWGNINFILWDAALWGDMNSLCPWNIAYLNFANFTNTTCSINENFILEIFDTKQKNINVI